MLTGPKGSTEWKPAKDMEDRIAEEIRKLGIDTRVRRLGYVAARDLDALYQEAVAMTFPSRFEGFGAPALEAMAHGCPVIGADATATPEVVQDGGRLVSPDNAEEWCRAMCDLIEDDQLRSNYAKKGIERAKEFTWERSAATLENAYMYALGTTL